MTTEPIFQAINQFKAANNILLLVSGGNNLDAAAAGLALKGFLEKLEKRVQIMSPTSLLPKFAFLPGAESLTSTASLSKNLMVEVSLTKTELAELSYHKQADKLVIYLTPKVGEFEVADAVVKSAAYPYDLIAILGAANLEELGSLYSAHANMFFEIPVINLDYKAANENYGQINLVNLTSSALAEIVFDLLNEYDPNFIDDKIATLLLAGLVFATNSFQSQKTTPQAFLKASKLVSLGGKQQEIISQLYRSKSLGLLRLWGRALARLKHDADKQLVYSVVSPSDIERSEAMPGDVDAIIFEMIQQLSFAKFFVFFTENSGQTICYAASLGPVNIANLFAVFNPANLGQQAYKFTVPKPILTAETEIIASIQQELDKYRS